MDEVMQRLLEWGETQSSVRAMLMTSTRAIPHAPVDALSDYDVVLAVGEIRPFHQDRRWLEHFGRVLVSYWDPIHPNPDYGLEQTGNVIQYEDGLKIDFTLWPVDLLRRIAQSPALPAELDAGYVALLDKDGLMRGLPPPSYQAYRVTLPPEEAFLTFVEEFFSDAPYVAKCLWREELMPAKWCLDYDMKHIYLRRLLEWRIALDHGSTVKVGALGKGLKRYLPPTLWAELEGCYAGAGVAENWNALFQTLALFRQVATDVAARLGYAYPHDLDHRVTAYVRRIQQM